MILAMTELIPPNTLIKPQNENWFVASWVEIPLEKESFDLILGDASFNNVPFSLQDQMFSQLKSLLKPGGNIVHRTIYISEVKNYTAKQIIEKALNQNLDKNLGCDLFFSLFIACWKEFGQAPLIDKMKEFVKEYLIDNRIVTGNQNLDKQLNTDFTNYWFSLSAAFPVFFSQDVDEMYGRYFKTLETYNAPYLSSTLLGQLFGQIMPIHVLAKL